MVGSGCLAVWRGGECGISMWGYPLDSQKVNPPVEMVFVNVRGDKPVQLKSIAGA